MCRRLRKLFAVLATGFLALGMADSANAALLNWSGTMELILGDFPRAILQGGGVATINGSAGAIPAHLQTLRLAESRGHVEGTFTAFATDPDTAANGVAALIYTHIQGQAGTIVGISGGVASTSTGPGGTMAWGGIVKVCLLSTTCTLYLPMALSQPTTVNGAPGTGVKGIGVGGLITVGGFGAIRISIQAAPWTVKTVTVLDQITLTPGSTRTMTEWVARGWAHAPVSTTTSTAQPGGMVQLVTPNQLVTNLPLGSYDKAGSFVYLVLRFIPEPGLALLLCSGVAGLAVLGRRRMRR